MNNSLGIIGGVGPLASSYFYELITKSTKADKDQEHLNILLFSHATIPDRTAYILNHECENPYPYLLKDAKTLEKLGAKMIAIPCNTSCYFHDKLQNEVNIPIRNMIDDTALYVKQKGFKKVAIMATMGTIRSNLYQEALTNLDIEFVIPDTDKVMSLIYDYIKGGKNVSKELFNSVIEDLNVDGYILGCTELSIIKKDLNLDNKFIDPLEVEVTEILNFFNKEKLERKN